MTLCPLGPVFWPPLPQVGLGSVLQGPLGLALRAKSALLSLGAPGLHQGPPYGPLAPRASLVNGLSPGQPSDGFVAPEQLTLPLFNGKG